MKIISGKYKGRVLKGFDLVGTRPTMDRVKESVFASIQDYIKGSIVLDLYAGTGNLGIEAISNGAKEAYFVDNNKNAINIIKNNIKMLNIDNTNIVLADASKALKEFINDNKTFDIIFLDPPYKTDEIEKILNIINQNINVINKDGIIVCETELTIDYNIYNNLYIYKTKRYGQKNVNILKINN